MGLFFMILDWLKITYPIAQAEFLSLDAVSKSMEEVLTKIYESNIDTESRSLKRFYDSVKNRAADIKTANGRQQLILELYDRFFKNAFPCLSLLCDNSRAEIKFKLSIFLIVG